MPTYAETISHAQREIAYKAKLDSKKESEKVWLDISAQMIADGIFASDQHNALSEIGYFPYYDLVSPIIEKSSTALRLVTREELMSVTPSREAVIAEARIEKSHLDKKKANGFPYTPDDNQRYVYINQLLIDD